MINLAIAFLVIAIIAAWFEFATLAKTAAAIAQIVF